MRVKEGLGEILDSFFLFIHNLLIREKINNSLYKQ